MFSTYMFDRTCVVLCICVCIYKYFVVSNILRSAHIYVYHVCAVRQQQVAPVLM